MILNKRIATRFKNEFGGILKQLGEEDSLSNIAFCNVNSKGGDKSKGQKYENALKNVHTKLEKIVVLNPKKQLYIFTCIDVYEKLVNSWKYKYGVKEQDGIQYFQNKAGTIVSKKSFVCQIGDKNVTVYEMYHPSRRGGYKLQEKLFYETDKNLSPKI